MRTAMMRGTRCIPGISSNGTESERFEWRSDYQTVRRQTDMGPGNVSPFTVSHVEQGDFGVSLRCARNEGAEMGM